MRVSVNIIEVEASVLHVCSFTLPPVLPLTPVTLPLNFSIFLYSQSKTDVVVLGGFKLFFPLYLTSNLALPDSLWLVYSPTWDNLLNDAKWKALKCQYHI